LCIRTHYAESSRAIHTLMTALVSSPEFFAPISGVETWFPRLKRLELKGFRDSGTLDTIDSKTISELVQHVLKTLRSKGVGVEHLKITGHCVWGDMDGIASLVDDLEYQVHSFENLFQ